MFGVGEVIFYLEFQNIFTKKHSKKNFTMKASIHKNKQSTCIYDSMSTYEASTCVITNQGRRIWPIPGRPLVRPSKVTVPCPRGKRSLGTWDNYFFLFTTYIYILKQYGLPCLFLNFNEQINTTLLFCVVSFLLVRFIHIITVSDP